MLTGRRAFRGDSPVETMNAILKEDPPELGVDARLERVAASRRRSSASSGTAWKRTVTERFQEMHDVAFALGNNEPFERIGRFRRRRLAEDAPDKPRTRRGMIVAISVAGAAHRLAASASRRRFVAARRREVPLSGHSPGDVLRPRSLAWPFRLTAAWSRLSSTRDGRPRIWVRQMSGGGELALTEGIDSFPSWSPDGASILFLRTSDGAHLRRLPRSRPRRRPRKLIDDASDAAWSPDGTKIAITRTTPHNGGYDSLVLTAAPDGSGLQEIATIA